MRLFSVTLGFCCLTLSTLGQTHFSGTWLFNNQSSISGNLYSNGSPKQITITQTPKLLIIERISATGDGTDNTVIDSLPLNGKQFHFFSASGRKKETTLIINNEKTNYTITSLAYNKAEPTKVDFKNTDIFTIENDQLVLIRKNENFTNGETWESKAVYDKK